MSAPLATVREGTAPTEAAVSSVSRRRALLRVFVHDRTALVCGGFVVLLVLVAVCAPLIAKITGWGPYTFDSAAIDPARGGAPRGSLGGISWNHPLGVEPLNGRDLLARITYGARASIAIALSATIITTVVGVVAGMLAGYHGGRVDQAISRFMDLLMAFPALIFMIAILSSLPPGNRELLLVAVISVFGWPYVARVVRGQTISLAQREFVEAARASGANGAAIVFREILPNLQATIVVIATLAVPGFVGTEAGLSFIGVGVTPPTPTWGQMISSASSWYAVDPMFLVLPSVALFATVLSLTVLGDRFRRVLENGQG